MSYKLHPNVFFKKIADDQVNLLLSNDDNYIFKLNKVAARVFLMAVEKNLGPEEIRKEVLELTKKTETEVDTFLNDFFNKMVEHNFLEKK